MLDTLNSHDNCYICHCKLPCYLSVCLLFLNTMLRIVAVVPFFVAQTCIWHHLFGNEIKPPPPPRLSPSPDNVVLWVSKAPIRLPQRSLHHISHQEQQRTQNEPHGEEKDICMNSSSVKP